MKTQFKILLSSLLIIMMLTLGACGNTDESEVVTPTDPVDVNVLAMNGPTAMGMVHFMNESESGNITDNNYMFGIEAAIDNVVASVVNGDTDIAAVPANVSSVLFNNTEGKVQVMGINTLGVLYIMENGENVQSITDLEGKTIYAFGAGATPEYALSNILAQNDLTDKVTVEWKSSQDEVVAALGATDGAVGMLPQPFATVAQTNNASIRTALDLTEEWENTDSEGSLVTGVIVVNKAFADANPAAVANFMEHYQTSVNYTNENVEEAAELVAQYEIVGAAPIAQAAIPLCNITLIQGEEMKSTLSGYLQVLFNQNPTSVGGTMPTDDFYLTEIVAAE